MSSDAPPVVGDPDLPETRVVVPAGGSGTRLWPLSRRDRPKFLVDVGYGEPLVSGALRRACRLVRPEHVRVVTGTKHAQETAALAAELGIEAIVAEPAPRDTGPAIALGTTIVARTNPDAIVVSVPADQVVVGDVFWDDTMRAAIRAADGGSLVTIGIPPRAPETGFGYIHAAQGRADDASFLVESFKEKPDAATAREYFTAGGYYWNAGIFAWRARTFAERLEHHAPELAHAVDDVVDAWFESGAVDARLWDAVPRIAIDYALLEPAADAGEVRVVPAAFQWWDLGTWPSIVELATTTGGEALSIGARDTVTSVNSENCFVHQATDSGRTYALLGVRDIIVVDTGDVTMIADSRAAQDVRSLVAEMERAGRTHLT